MRLLPWRGEQTDRISRHSSRAWRHRLTVVGATTVGRRECSGSEEVSETPEATQELPSARTATLATTAHERQPFQSIALLA